MSGTSLIGCEEEDPLDDDQAFGHVCPEPVLNLPGHLEICSDVSEGHWISTWGHILQDSC
jgi:hypothetical protein